MRFQPDTNKDLGTKDQETVYVMVIEAIRWLSRTTPNGSVINICDSIIDDISQGRYERFPITKDMLIWNN